MKRIKIFSLLALTAFAVASFNACKGDKEDDNTNDDAVVFTDGDVQYKMSLSELKDNDSELSFNQVIEYIKPIDLKEDITFTFKYSADSVAASDSASSDKKSLPITEASMVINCGSESNAQMVRDSMLTDTVSYIISVEGSKVICTYKKEVLENMTYAAAEAFYNELAKKLGDQRKKNDANKAKEENDAKKQEAENNRKTNYKFDRDSVGAIISTDSTIEFTLVKAGVAAVYSYKIDNEGNVVSGSVICVCKNSDVAKAYAKEHMKDKNAKGQLIYKSINLDGSNVIMVYSASAIEGLHKRDIVAAQQSGKEPDASSIGSNTDVEENNEGENNGENTENQQEENNNSQNSENEQNENGNNQNTENNQNENNQSENNQNAENNQNENNNSENTELTPEENSNIKPGENEENNNGENEESNIPQILPENGENALVGKWKIFSMVADYDGDIDDSIVEDEGMESELEFTNDGKFISIAKKKSGYEERVEGTYTISGNVVIVTVSDEEEEDDGGWFYFSVSGNTLVLISEDYYDKETGEYFETKPEEGVDYGLEKVESTFKRM